MRACEIMTAKVNTVNADSSVGDIARLMTAERISGVPVVGDDGRVIGIVGETGLMHRAETGTERRRKWWSSLFLDDDMRARDFIESHGIKAADIMTHVEDVLEVNNLKRVPVIKNGNLVGIITRGDLVRAFASGAPPGNTALVQQTLNEQVKRQPWLDKHYLNMIVDEQTVELWGFVDFGAQHRALPIFVGGMGERCMEDNVIVGPRRGMAA